MPLRETKASLVQLGEDRVSLPMDPVEVERLIRPGDKLSAVADFRSALTGETVISAYGPK